MRPSSTSVAQNKAQIQFNVAGSIAAQAQCTPHGHVIQETEQSNDSQHVIHPIWYQTGGPIWTTRGCHMRGEMLTQ